MKTSKLTPGILFFFLLSLFLTNAQEPEVIYVKMATEKKEGIEELKTYLIEREIPDAGELSAEQLKGISQKSCSVITELGPTIKWLHSYVTEDKVYCIYQAANEELIKEHAERGGFPVNYVTELSTTIDPNTAK